jgi:hypothetical protein
LSESTASRFGRHSFGRRIVTRAVVVLGAVFVGGQVMRTLPHDQTLVFPVGSVFPDATRFSASWRTVDGNGRDRTAAKEPSGGVTLSFKSAPPLQIRQHTRLPNGDYMVTIEIVHSAGQRETNHESDTVGEGLQTNIERRVSLSGGETMIALAVSTSVPE